MKKTIILKIKIFVVAFFATTFASASASVLTAEADSAYVNGDYAKASELYQKVIEENGTSAELLYNLGNAAYKDGDFGTAMVSWLRARRLEPSNAQVNTNIDFLKNKVEDANKAEQRGKRMKVTEDESSFFHSIWTWVAQDTASNVWAVWGAVCFLLFVGCVAMYIFSRMVLVRKAGFFGGMALGALNLIFVIFAEMAADASKSTESGVVMLFKTALATEPDKPGDAQKNPVLTRGTVVTIVAEETDAEGNVTWYKVRLNSDYIGWLPASSIEIV